MRSVNPVSGKAPDGQTSAPYIPPLKQVGFTGRFIKFTQTKEQPLIEFGNYQEADETVYYVRDNGIGFDMEFAKQIFVPFQRLHPMEEFEGSGIGLAIVKRIIDRHNGDIWVESEIDQGTTVYFKL